MSPMVDEDEDDDVDEDGEEEDDDLKKNIRIKPRKMKDQNVSFTRGVECHLKR